MSATGTDGMLELVLEQPDHLLDALWRVDSAALSGLDAPGGLVICGMGGSAIGGELAAAAIGRRATRPIVTVRDYELPSYAPKDALYLCSSYSGRTQETLSSYAAAGELGARRVALTTGGSLAERARADGVPVVAVPGGLEPRAAVGYMTVGALELAALSGAAPSLRPEVEAASALLRDLIAAWEPEGGEPELIARRLAGRVPVIYGGGPTDAVATRWKTQLNENPEVPAFRGTLPEADHNEIQGYASAERWAAVFLEDPQLHERTRRRMELTAAFAERCGAATVRVPSRGESLTERVLSLVLLGDLVSVRLAEILGVDPTPVEAIEAFKRELG